MFSTVALLVAVVVLAALAAVALRRRAAAKGSAASARADTGAARAVPPAAAAEPVVVADTDVIAEVAGPAPKPGAPVAGDTAGATGPALVVPVTLEPLAEAPAATPADAAAREAFPSGVSDLFVHLGRRNQALLDRQIALLDELEHQEQDPDVLDRLFRLDHLAARMRRNAESLLVLAGGEPSRRRTKPAEVVDVVRVAIGEVEQYTRVRIVGLDDARVIGGPAGDLAHLLAELIENGTQFSPPDTPVDVAGFGLPDGSYAITVSDRGIGMTELQLEEANRALADPPPFGLAVRHSLGLTVVSRLASRFGIGVRLTSEQGSGVAAVVTLPSTVLERSVAEVPVEPAPEAPVAAAPEAPVAAAPEAPVAAAPEAPVEPTPEVPVATAIEAPVEPAIEAPVEPAPEVPVATAAEARVDEPAEIHDAPTVLPAPTAAALDALAGLPAGSHDEPASLVETAPAAHASTDEPEPAPAEPAVGAAPVVAPDWPDDPVPPAVWAAGARPGGTTPLPVRVSRDGEPSAEEGLAGLTRRVPRSSLPDEARPDGPTIAPPTRSPEQVREVLSRYRNGLRSGRGAVVADDAPATADTSTHHD